MLRKQDAWPEVLFSGNVVKNEQSHVLSPALMKNRNEEEIACLRVCNYKSKKKSLNIKGLIGMK